MRQAGSRIGCLSHVATPADPVDCAAAAACTIGSEGKAPHKLASLQRRALPAWGLAEVSIWSEAKGSEK